MILDTSALIAILRFEVEAFREKARGVSLEVLTAVTSGD
jgi:uncharacterized protein with PIN domain